MVLHQFCDSVSPGDATSDHLFLIQRWLQAWGFHSEIYAEHIPTPLKQRVRPYSLYRPTSAEKHIIYHHASGSDILPSLLDVGLPFILIYHNITPPNFFDNSQPSITEALLRGRKQLAELPPYTALALGDSDYNAHELQETGFQQTGVLPIVLDPLAYQHPVNPVLAQKLAQNGPNLLFIGRIAPNKRQEDLVKLLYYVRRIRPNTHLHLVGSSLFPSYTNWLHQFIAYHKLEQHVQIVGHVSMSDMVTYYQSADLFISMSEHEGFGKPLIESMYFDLPVLAYNSTAVPYTLGGSGVLFHQKEYELLAELTVILLEDQALRQKLIAGQRDRLADFLVNKIQQRCKEYLQTLHYFSP